ncbi:MAG: circularly permuted type 2 ATP-grasp protein [Gemmataceae bacterium]|nr:circularly permuted type 2 ATP-grasp protein [Gemmataceae bacterium]
MLGSLAGESVLRRYRAPLGGGFDEMIDGDGRMRDHWHGFGSSLDSLTPQEFAGRWEDAQKVLHANGVSYNLHSDPRGAYRPWKLDPIPFLVAQEDGDRLAKGLVQRARLLEAILRDLYGPRRLLLEGVLPAEVVFGNPAFLRACHGISPPTGRFLHMLAVDVGRGPDGQFWALGDRTQVPNGAGYALENRIILSRMLPEAFGECNVQRLALFFRTFRDMLRSLAPHHRDNPRIVLLSPGPKHETYFEHAYLARYLGYTLAEGADLTVRDNHVYLKFLDGLQPVDVILRRLRDESCDPLEFHSSSFAGIPGLVQAVRARNVAIANALGCGLAESPAFLPYLGAVSRHLFGEDLMLPTMPSYWCGEAKQREKVLASLDCMVVKAAFSRVRSKPIFGIHLSEESKRKLSDQIRANPSAYVGQQYLPLSQAPVLTDRGIEPRPILVRSFLCASEKDFFLMPGGLTRFAQSPESMLVSVQEGGGSKDTWVLSRNSVSTFSLLKPAHANVEITRGGADLPSRSADHLFWLGRYVERTEGLIRLLRGIVVRLIEKPSEGEAPETAVLFRAARLLAEGVTANNLPDPADPEAEVRSLAFDRDRVGSLAFNLASIGRAASTVRDRVSMDMWRVIASLETPMGASDPTEEITLGDVLDVLNRGVITLAAFAGLAGESMTRGHGWRFLDIGRGVERAMHLIVLIRACLRHTTQYEPAVLEAMLEIADSQMTYRRRYLNTLDAAAVLDLLLADESNPRSLISQFVRLRLDVDHLPNGQAGTLLSPERRLALAFLSKVQLADIAQLAKADSRGKRWQLDALLEWLEAELPKLSEAISQLYLSHLQVSRHLAGN